MNIKYIARQVIHRATSSTQQRSTHAWVFAPHPPPSTVELAMIMDRLYGGVCYAGIDTDPELKYPKGAGRVAFSNQQSYIAAISARFVQLQHGDIDKRVGSGSGESDIHEDGSG